ncbi:hypothetical protein JCM11641_004143 [Rhodosporidiobolus odoratus]
MFCGMVNDPTWITIANLIFLGLFSLSFVSADTPDLDAAAKAVNSHKPRVNPTGNVDPLAEQSTSTAKQEGSNERRLDPFRRHLLRGCSRRR